MAGQPGFELFGPWEDAEAVLAALLEAGAHHGLVRVGAKAYSTSNLGSGWAPAPLPAIFGDDPLLTEYRQWLPIEKVGSLGGSLDSADIGDYYLTPYDIGYGKTIKFDHDFVGRQALERMAQGTPSRTKVTLVWNADDVTAAIGSLYGPGPGAKYIEMPKARYATHHEDTVLVDGKQVGISLDCGYLANEREMVSLAAVDTALAEPGTEVTVVWGEHPVSAKPAVEDHRQVQIRAVVAPCPYDARENYRSR
jgi:vanillate/3-O-methylgallate O-demethylase